MNWLHQVVPAMDWVGASGELSLLQEELSNFETLMGIREDYSGSYNI